MIIRSSYLRRRRWCMHRRDIRRRHCLPRPPPHTGFQWRRRCRWSTGSPGSGPWTAPGSRSGRRPWSYWPRRTSQWGCQQLSEAFFAGSRRSPWRRGIPWHPQRNGTKRRASCRLSSGRLPKCHWTHTKSSHSGKLRNWIFEKRFMKQLSILKKNQNILPRISDRDSGDGEWLSGVGGEGNAVATGGRGLQRGVRCIVALFQCEAANQSNALALLAEDRSALTGANQILHGCEIFSEVSGKNYFAGGCNNSSLST